MDVKKATRGPSGNFPHARLRESLKYSDRIIICEMENETSVCAGEKVNTAAEQRRRRRSPSALIHSLSFVCPEVRKHTVVLNYQAQSAAGIFAGRFQQRKPPPPAPRGGYQQIATKMFSPAFRLPASECSTPRARIYTYTTCLYIYTGRCAHAI